MKLSKAKPRNAAPLTDEQKQRRKELNRARDEKRRAENLAQRELIESRRTY